MDENFAYRSSLFQREGKWLCSSPAPSTDVIANIIDRLSSNMSCYQGYAIFHRFVYSHPHGGPITQSSTGSKPHSPVHLWLQSILCTFRMKLPSHRSMRRSILVSDAISIFIAQNPLYICLGIKRLPNCLKPLSHHVLFPMNFVSCNLSNNSRPLVWVRHRIPNFV